MPKTLIDKMLDRATEYERKAAAIREVVADFNGELHGKKLATHNGTMARAVALRREQRNGDSEHADGARDLAVAPASPTRRTSSRRRQADPHHKARIIAGILKDAGVALDTKELSAAAHEKGIKLQGIWNVIRAGYIKKKGKGKNGRYTFVSMPPEPGEAAPVE